MSESSPPSGSLPAEPRPEAYAPPAGARAEIDTPAGTARVDADWILLRERERVVADVFTVSYRRAASDGDPERPVTFVFNGGPGASSAYLHVGALGPRRVRFESAGAPPPPPARLEPNPQTWLHFTDLVFIDPVGTGFSRALAEIDPRPPGTKDAEPKGEAPSIPFWAVEKDLDALGEAISRWLSKHHRWTSPAFLAGESYGGFRVARMARSLQEKIGIGLNGVSLISPALELMLLFGSDYDSLAWCDVFPSMALAAAYHGRAATPWQPDHIQTLQEESEQFAAHRLAPLLALGEAVPAEERRAVLEEQSQRLSLSFDGVQRRLGRVSAPDFVRELMRDERRVLGLYDASLTAVDPFPDRPSFEGPDPTLWAIERVFTAGINHLLRAEIGVDTERDYRILNMAVNQAWKVDRPRHGLDSRLGATDELRYAMSLNPHLKVFVSHGLFDLVTPYAASKRLMGLMRLDNPDRILRREYLGGHMFYCWERSRQAFFRDGRTFTEGAVRPG